MTDPLIAELRRRAVDPALATDEKWRAGAAPLDAAAIMGAERTLGRALPPLLREVYGTVGNGGFGPGHGLLPLVAVDSNDELESVVDLYCGLHATDPEDPVWSWPDDLVLFCDWGCAIRSCVDTSSPEGAVVTFDPNVRAERESMDAAFALTHTNLRAWFEDWIAGVKLWDLMFEPDPSRATEGINPFTRKPYRFVPSKLHRL